MNKQKLASRIWESANKMRSKIEANEYKDYILGFIFYKYLSEREEDFLKANRFPEDQYATITEDNKRMVEFLQNKIGFFISHDNLFSSWLKKGKDFDVSNVRDAISAFNRLVAKKYKKLFENIFNTLETGLSKLGDNSGSQTKAISGLLQLIKDIPMDGKQGYDVLGFIYEYLISMFAANAGKKAGEFYTPHEVAILMSEIVAWNLRGKSEIEIYDPTSGSGSLLITIGKAVAKYKGNSDHIKYYAQELKENTYNLTRMNLIMRGIIPDNIVTRNGDTLEDDWPYFDDQDPASTYQALYVDAVVSNPPYSQNWDPTDRENDIRYIEYGVAPKAKADYAFLLHDLYHVKPDGVMTIVLPHGVLFRGGEEGAIRKSLIEHNNIDAIIGLPANIFFGTGIPTIIMVLKKDRQDTGVMIIDASKGFIKEGKNNKLRACDIKKIVDAYKAKADVDKFARYVSRDEIRENEYNLNIPRYVDSSEKADSWDIYASMFGGVPDSELDEYSAYWEAFNTLRNRLFSRAEGPYSKLAVKDIKETILDDPSVKGFKNRYEDAFRSFRGYMKDELLTPGKLVETAKEEDRIAEEIFKRLSDIPLVNKYEAYQSLDEIWATISSDIEVMQTEGFEAAKIVDPKMISKKKDNKDVEVQDGWAGRIMPFDLIQSVFLSDEYASIEEKNNELSSIPGKLEELLGDLEEDVRESDIVNDEGDAFVSKNVSKKIKELKKERDPDSKALLKKLIEIDNCFTAEKKLKKDIKESEAEIINKTKAVIENLTDEEVYLVLEKKWVDGLIDALSAIPEKIIDDFSSKIVSLCKKYDTTYLDIEKEIKETESELCAMLDDLTGNEFDMKGIEEFKDLLRGI